jgi:mannan endo-1,4-beta-mannosidase
MSAKQVFLSKRSHPMHLVAILLILTLRTGRTSLSQTADNDFIYREGAHLILHAKPFRYAGANVYWLGLDQNVGGVSYPTHFRVDDALDTAKRMGATVVRAHTVGISTGGHLSLEPSLGRFNETAFEAIDYAIFSAHQHGIRLLVPLTDNYHYYNGGKHDFTDWEHLPENEFFTNAKVIADFESYIDHLLEHVNPLTGLALKNDPTIFAWETGNEIWPPTAWTAEISAHLKRADPKHLVLDGHYGVDAEAADLPTVDLCGAHFNSTRYKMTGEALRQQVEALAGKRPYIIGEFDWQEHHKGGDLTDFLKEALSNSGVDGATYWSLFGHADTYGYVQHGDGFTLHYPGDAPEMHTRAAALRDFAFAMSGMPTPTEPPPATPLLTGAGNGMVTWRGAAGAATYELDRSKTSPRGPWSVVTNSAITDNDLPFHDIHRPHGHVWYRVRAVNTVGMPGPFSPVAESQ